MGEMQKREAALLGRERSYRNEREGAGFLAAVMGLPLIMVILPKWIGMSPFQPLAGISFQEYGPYFFIWLFLAYRAHQKLTLLKHIKYHLTKEQNEQSTSSDDSHATNCG